jgi:hypothetical protein
VQGSVEDTGTRVQPSQFAEPRGVVLMSGSILFGTDHTGGISIALNYQRQ